MPGITFANASQISAQEMLEHIQTAGGVPAYFVKALSARGQSIEFDRRVKPPRGERVPDWVDLAHIAFLSDNWQLTTGKIQYVGDGTVLNPDIDGEDKPGRWMATPDSQGKMKDDFRPVLQLPVDGKVLGDTIPLEIMAVKDKGRGLQNVPPPYMRADASGSRGKRGLIVVANREEDRGNRGSRLIPPQKIVQTFFHELACHAGRLSRNQTWEHSTDPKRPSNSDRLSLEVEEAFQPSIDRLLPP